MTWDPDLYERFKRERHRPFFDLLAAVPDGPVRRVADLGCGTAELTRTLLDRWPDAEVWGVEVSAEMLERAGEPTERLHLVEADLRDWEPEAPLDRLVSNAVLHWVPDHAGLLRRLAGFLAPGGVLAVQAPNNRAEAAYRILDQMLREPDWAARLPADLTPPRIESPLWYVEHLAGLGLSASVWETTYYHQLPGPGEIVEWMKGATLRPVLAALSESDGAAFLDELNQRVAVVYSPVAGGVAFPFRRLFFVAARPEE